MTALLANLDRRADLRARAGLARVLRSRGPADATVDLAGNDYLGLARHPEVLAAAAAALSEYGLGATGSRLVRGTTYEHDMLERELAALLGWPAALVYSSGYLANLAAIRAVVRPNTPVIVDAHAHASLVDGCRLAGTEITTVPHADVDAVSSALAAPGGQTAVVVTESVFSVEGDLAPLAELHAAARAHGATLLVDDAHAFGVLGRRGAGAVAAAGLTNEPDVIVTTTLSKAAGAAGGVIAAHPAVIRHLIDTSRTFLYDTALPPAVAAGARAAVRLLPGCAGDRAVLRDRAQLAAATFQISLPAAGIVTVTAPSAAEAVVWAGACADRGVAVGCFRPPSTPDNRSRLRITINTGISDDDFARALKVIAATAPRAPE